MKSAIMMAVVAFCSMLLATYIMGYRGKEVVKVIPFPVLMPITVPVPAYLENTNPRQSDEWKMLRFMVGNEEAIKAYEILCDEVNALNKDPDRAMPEEAADAIRTINKLVPKNKVPVYRDQFVKACVE